MGSAVRFQLRGRLLHRRTLATIGTRSKLWAELHFTSSSRAVYANPPDWPQMLVWMRHPLADGLFVDVGANVGLYSLLAAELGAQVIALEPGRDAHLRLVENAALNGYAIDARRVVAADRPGELRFTQDRDAVNRIAKEGEVGESIAAVTLDDLLDGRTAAGVKIDVEGFERLVLHGASRALAERRIGLLQLEWNPHSVEALGEDREPVARLLSDAGYELLRPDWSGTLGTATDPEMGEDVFARPRH